MCYLPPCFYVVILILKWRYSKQIISVVLSSKSIMKVTNMKKIIFYNENDIQKIDSKIERIDMSEFYIKDLFEIRHPMYYKKNCEIEFATFKKDLLDSDEWIWVFYPWLNKAFKLPKESNFFEVFTSRNKPLISFVEQENFYHYRVGVIGLSVGQSIVLNLVRSGGAKNLKIADFDTISPSNLNRLQSGIQSIGSFKTAEVVEKILEINPYLKITEYVEGLTPENCNDFMSNLDVVIDACDNFAVKLLIRECARSNKIPVIMATDVGDGSLIDIERYDLNKNIEPFGGRHKKISNPNDFLKAAVTIISPENIPLALQDRFLEIGKTTPTHPQLANSVFFSATLISYIVRSLSNKKELVDSRVFIDYNELFDPVYRTDNFEKIKQEKINNFKVLLGLE